MEDSFPIILTSRIIRPSADTQEDTQALSVVIVLIAKTTVKTWYYIQMRTELLGVL